MSPQLEMLKGTLDLMVLQTLQAMGALHGYGIARRIEQVSREAILLNQGTIYASLVRLQQRGLIKSEWGVSENNRKAKFYAITSRGSKRLAETAENWEQLSAVIARFFAAAKEGQWAKEAKPDFGQRLTSCGPGAQQCCAPTRATVDVCC